VRAFDRSLGLLVRALTATAEPIQRLFGFEHAPRGLLPGERAVLFDALGDAIDLDPVRIVRSRSLDTWVPGEGHVARAIGQTIYMPTADLAAPDGDLSGATLVHEACHVVQFQRGGSAYIGDSVRAQLGCIVRGQSRSGAYDWRSALAEGRPWAELGAEQQAALIEDAWRSRSIDQRVREALEEARGGRGWCGC